MKNIGKKALLVVVIFLLVIGDSIGRIGVKEVHAATNPDIGNRTSAPYSYLYGSSYWTTSNIREWLNSNDRSGQVLYTNDPPTRAKLGTYGYDQEAGFLYGFTSAEQEGIAVTERRSFVNSNLGTRAKDGGTSNIPRFDGLVPSNNIHISSPDIHMNWKSMNYQKVNEKVFMLGIHEMYEYVQKRGFSTKKGLIEPVRRERNISSAYYQYFTSNYNYSNANSEAVWGYTTSGFGTSFATSQPMGVMPAIHLKPDYRLSNGKLARDVNVGEIVSFGKYKNATLKWKVINKTTDGYPLLWAEESVDIKRFDAPGDKLLRNSVSVNFPRADISIFHDLKFTNGKTDTTSPYLKVKDDTAMSIRQNDGFSMTVQAFDTDSGIDYMILPDNSIVRTNEVSYYFSSNARYYFTAVDKAGNHYGFEVPIGNINPPAEVMVTPSVTDWTNRDVQVDIKTNQVGTDWYDKGPRTLNRSGYSAPALPEYTTYSEKRFRVRGEVKLVSKKDERFNVGVRMSYNRIIPYGNNYRVSRLYPFAYNIPLKNLKTNTFTSFDSTFTVGGDYFEKLQPSLSISHSAIDNGNYSIQWRNVSVELLDKEDFYIEKIILPSGKEVYTDTYVDTLSEEGVHTYKVLDSRGMITEKSVEVKIDKTNPTIVITGNPTKVTDKDIVLNVKTDDDRSGVKRVLKPNGEWDERSSFEYHIYENGTYTFTVEDYAGNRAQKTVTVSAIDTIDPTIQTSYDEAVWHNTSYQLNVSASDNVSVATILLPDGKVISGNKATYEVSTNQTYTFGAIDTSGNESTYTVHVKNIDRNLPRLEITENTEDGITSIHFEYSDK